MGSAKRAARLEANAGGTSTSDLRRRQCLPEEPPRGSRPMRACAAAGAILLSSVWALSSAGADEPPARMAAQESRDHPLDSGSIVAALDPAPVVAPRRAMALALEGAVLALGGYAMGLAWMSVFDAPVRYWWLVPLVGAPLSYAVGALPVEEFSMLFVSSTAPQLIGLLVILVGLDRAFGKPGPPPRTGVRLLFGPLFVGLAVPFG